MCSEPCTSPGLDTTHGFLDYIRHTQRINAHQHLSSVDTPPKPKPRPARAQRPTASLLGKALKELTSQDHRLAKKAPQPREDCIELSKDCTRLREDCTERGGDCTDCESTDNAAEVPQPSEGLRADEEPPSKPRTPGPPSKPRTPGPLSKPATDSPDLTSWLLATHRYRNHTTPGSTAPSDNNNKPAPSDEAVTMATVDWASVDIDSYVEEAQPYIRTALKDPGAVPTRFLADVASAVVNRAWEDPGYYSTAATVCQRVAELERLQQTDQTIPSYTFRTGVVDACRLLMDDWRVMRDSRPDYWVSFCLFVAEIYRRIRPQGQRLVAVGNILGDILTQLTSTTCINNFQEVDLLCTLFHDCARDLHQDNPRLLDDVANSIRDAFLDVNTDAAMQGLLLPLIELHASGFQLSAAAKAFYFQM